MRVLVGCEESGVISGAFRAVGHEAWSCDLIPTRGDPAWHIQADLRTVPQIGWDLVILHPPCTDLAVSGARWFKAKGPVRIQAALDFFRFCLDFDAPRVMVENPISIASTHFGKPTQIIQPWMFGHGEVKATCLWLRNLPKLVPTEIVSGRVARVHRMPPSPTRERERSATLPGVAAAMAAQWGGLT